jgi:hypothetical protein
VRRFMKAQRRRLMKIELKNVKVYSGLSQETEAFTASLYVDGKRVGETRNAGHGGNNSVDVNDKDGCWDTELIKRMEAEAARHTWSYEGETYDHNLDSYISDLLSAWQDLQQQKRLCRGKTLARLPDEKYAEGQWSVFKLKYTPVVAAKLRLRYGRDTVFLNEQVR